MDRRRPAQGFHAGLREPQRAHLAFPHQFGHRADGFLDGRARVHAVLVIQVDHVHAQPSQARLAGAAHVRGRTVHPGDDPFVVDLEPELRRQHHAFAPGFLEEAVEQFPPRSR